MKKFLSLLCAVVLVLSASAAPFAKVAKKDFRKVAKLPKIENLESQRITTPLFKDFKAISKAPAVKKDVAAPVFLQAMFLGTLNDSIYGTSGDMSWTLLFFGGADTTLVGAVDITTEVSNKIAGDYEVSGWAVFAAGDTAEVSGLLSLEAASDEAYHVYLQAADEQNRAWNIDAELETLALDYWYYPDFVDYYSQYKETGAYEDYLKAMEAREKAFITLDDFKVVPTGEVKNVLVDLPSVQEGTGVVAYGGMSADRTYAVQLAFKVSETMEFPYQLAYEDFLMNYTYLENKDGEIKIDTIWDGLLSESADTLVIDAKLLGVDGIQYNIHMLSYEPTAQDTIRYAFADTAKVEEYDADFYFFINDANYILRMDIYGSYAAGEYSLANGDLYERYVGLFAINGTDTAYVDYQDIKVAIAEGEEVNTIQVEYFGKDKNYYIFTVSAAKPAAPSENVISISYDATERAVTYSPSNSDTYFFYIIEKAGLDEMLAVYSQDSLAVVKYMISYMSQYQIISSFVTNKAIKLDMVKFLGSSAATGDFVALAAPISDLGKINGDVVYFEFRFDYPEAIENAEDGAKAVKRFENGQLIIEKNGIKYNALGVRL